MEYYNILDVLNCNKLERVNIWYQSLTIYLSIYLSIYLCCQIYVYVNIHSTHTYIM